MTDLSLDFKKKLVGEFLSDDRHLSASKNHLTALSNTFLKSQEESILNVSSSLKMNGILFAFPLRQDVSWVVYFA
jgi:hypothetical protein